MTVDERLDVFARFDKGDQVVRESRCRWGLLSSLIQDGADQGFQAAPALFGVPPEPLLRFRRQVANRDAGQRAVLSS